MVCNARVPSLLNSPGLASIGGVPVDKPYFNENMPLRNQPPAINTVALGTDRDLLRLKRHRDYPTARGPKGIV